MTLLPRCVLVERQTEFRDLLARHGTREQARFFLAQRGLALADVEERHLHHEELRARVLGAIPPAWRTATVLRPDLDRFLFAADDIVLVLGPGRAGGQRRQVPRRPAGDRAQPGAGPLPRRARQPAARGGRRPVRRPDGGRGARSRSGRWCRPASTTARTLLALNEIFVGHRSHQSARYRLAVGDRHEHQSSSGLIVVDRDRRDRLGDEHQPPARASRSSCPRRPRRSSRGSSARPGRARPRRRRSRAACSPPARRSS